MLAIYRFDGSYRYRRYLDQFRSCECSVGSVSDKLCEFLDKDMAPCQLVPVCR